MFSAIHDFPNHMHQPHASTSLKLLQLLTNNQYINWQQHCCNTPTALQTWRALQL
jgi:hypothetical protein